MIIKIIRSITLLAALAVSSYSIADKNLELDEFKHEYASYQKLVESNKWSESLPHAKRAYEMGQVLFGESHKNTSSLAYNYGLNLKSVGRKQEAEIILKAALDKYESVYGGKSVELIPVLMDLGHSISGVGKNTTQKKYYNRALKLTEQYYGDDSLQYAYNSTAAGIVLMSGPGPNNNADARRHLQNGYKLQKKHLGASSPGFGLIAFYLGKNKLSQRKFKQSVEYFNEALATFVDPDKPSGSMELSTHGFLVTAYEFLGKSELATRHCLAIGRMTPVIDTQDHQPLVKVAPVYPRSLLQSGREGYVIVEFDIDESGFIRNAKEVEHGGSKHFVPSALKAVKKFRYAPAFEDGSPVVAKGIKNKITFAIAK